MSSYLPSPSGKYVNPVVNEAADACLARGNAVFDADGNEDRKKRGEILQGNSFAYSTPTECLRAVCEAQGIDTRRLSDYDCIQESIQRAGGMGGSSFPALQQNLFDKAMMTPLRREELTWRKLCKISTLKDFKTTSRVNVGSASNLTEIANGAPVPRGYISDFSEYLKAKTFGIEMVIEYQTWLNDDVGALTGLPIEVRRKANKAVEDLVFAILTSNPTLNATNEQLFSAAHGNIETNGAPPSVTTIEAAMAAVATRRAPSPTGDDANDPGDHLNMEPQYLICPYKLKATADQLVKSMYDPTAAPGAQVANTVRDRFEVIANTRLDQFNEDGWFMAVDPNRYPTIEVGFLDGKEEPSVKIMDDWDTRGMKFAIWHDFDVKAMDYRGLYYNDGVT